MQADKDSQRNEVQELHRILDQLRRERLATKVMKVIQISFKKTDLQSLLIDFQMRKTFVLYL